MTHIPGTGHANRKRSLLKTLTWRTIGTMDTILIAFVITGNLAAGAAIGGRTEREMNRRRAAANHQEYE